MKKSMIILLSTGLLLAGCGNSQNTTMDNLTKAESKEDTELTKVNKEIADVKAQLKNYLNSYIKEYEFSAENAASKTQIHSKENYFAMATYLRVVYNAANMDTSSSKISNSINLIEEAIADFEKEINRKSLEEKKEFIKNMNSTNSIYYAVLDAKCSNVASVLTGEQFFGTFQIYFDESEKLNDEDFLTLTNSYIDQYTANLKDLETALDVFEGYRSNFKTSELILIDEYTDLLLESQKNNIAILKSLISEDDEDEIDKLSKKMTSQMDAIPSIQEKLKTTFSIENDTDDI